MAKNSYNLVELYNLYSRKWINLNRMSDKWNTNSYRLSTSFKRMICVLFSRRLSILFLFHFKEMTNDTHIYFVRVEELFEIFKKICYQTTSCNNGRLCLNRVLIIIGRILRQTASDNKQKHRSNGCGRRNGGLSIFDHNFFNFHDIELLKDARVKFSAKSQSSFFPYQIQWIFRRWKVNIYKNL